MCKLGIFINTLNKFLYMISVYFEKSLNIISFLDEINKERKRCSSTKIFFSKNFFLFAIMKILLNTVLLKKVLEHFLNFCYVP